MGLFGLNIIIKLIVIFIMNDSMSILLATTILALGGLGLYMYKSSDDDKKKRKMMFIMKIQFLVMAFGDLQTTKMTIIKKKTI